MPTLNYLRNSERGHEYPPKQGLAVINDSCILLGLHGKMRFLCVAIGQPKSRLKHLISFFKKQDPRKRLLCSNNREILGLGREAAKKR